MPYTTTYLDNGKGLLKTGTGIVTGVDIYSSTVRQGNDENTRRVCYGLADFTDTTELKITPDEIRSLVEANRKVASFCPGIYVAIIAPSAFSYAMSRLWHTTGDDLPWISNVFHARADAIAWLRKQFLLRDETGALLAQFPYLNR